MPVDTDKLKSAVPYLIDHDRACVKCGYNLLGLMSNAVCPECGRKIVIRKKDVPRYADNLVNAPLPWLASLATGSLVLFLASLGVFASLAAGALLASRDVAVGGMVAAGFGVFWYAGVWLVTRPRPVTKVTTVDPHKEWAVLRWTARATQPFWAISGVCLAVYANSGVPIHGLAAIPAFVIASLGLIPFCGIVANIAYWGSDTGLAGHLRACAWSVGFAATLITLHVINIATKANLMGGFWASMIAAVLLFFAVFPFFYIVFCCFQLQGMARWAMLNHATATAKDDRLRRNAARSAAAGPPPLPEDHRPVDIDSFNLGDSTVDEKESEAARRKRGHMIKPQSVTENDAPIPVERTTTDLRRQPKR